MKNTLRLSDFAFEKGSGFMIYLKIICEKNITALTIRKIRFPYYFYDKNTRKSVSMKISSNSRYIICFVQHRL